MVVVHRLAQPVTFGDCDPAGIVFYPNYFAWFDRAFHDWLRRLGGHANLCQALGAMGIGLVEVNARFRAPARDGQLLNIELSIAKWERKALSLDYEVRVDGRVAVVGHEVRGLFKSSSAGMIAADISDLKAYLESHDFAQDPN